MERTFKPIYGTLKIIGVLFVLICVLATIGIYREANLSPEEIKARDERARQIASAAKAQDRQDNARFVCWSGLKRTLHDPDSAQMVDQSTWPVFQGGGKYVIGDTYTVTMTGRAKNLYGAYVLREWRCEARIEGDQWRVLSIESVR